MDGCGLFGPARMVGMTQTRHDNLPTIDDLIATIDDATSRLTQLRGDLTHLRANFDAPPDVQGSALLGTDEAAAYLGISRSSIYNLIREGLPTVKFGTSTRIRRIDLDSVIAQRLDCQ